MPRAKVVVNLAGGNAYDVRIGDGLLSDIGQQIYQRIPSVTSVVLLSDSNVGPLYGSTVKESLASAGLTSVEITVPAGEESKSVDVASEIWQALATKKLDRNSCVVALGGGVVGDLSGFIASTYMRGISFVQVPTSLLAMVDSSVGGKTGINLPQGKNLVGAFLQPQYVCADIDALATLPEREWACGLGEIAKTATLSGGDFFFWLLENIDELMAHNIDALRDVITRCVVFKADVVGQDETERAGLRECLNYGHTLGHALEKLAGYGTFSHGQAVAEGMRFAARLAVAEADASMDFVEAQDELLDALGLEPLDFSAQAQDIIDAMLSDKKTRGNQIRFVLVREPGNWDVVPVDTEILQAHLNAWARSKA